MHRKMLLRKRFDPSRSPEQGQYVVVANHEDNAHCFCIHLFRDSRKVCEVAGRALPYPNNTCVDAVNVLVKLTRTYLVTPRSDLACLAYTQQERRTMPVPTTSSLAMASTSVSLPERDFVLVLPDPAGR